MLLRPQGKGVHVNALIRSTGVRLVRLNPREVGSLTLGEAVLAVELELRRDDGVLSPAVHVEGGLREDERAGIGDKGLGLSSAEGAGVLWSRVPSLGSAASISPSIVKPTRRSDEGGGGGRKGREGSERGVGVGEGINRIRVVEGLGSKNAEEGRRARKTSAVVNVLVGLNNPNKLLDGVVEVELDLVGGGPNRLVSGELELSDEVLVGVLGHAAALISVEEDIVDVEGGRNKGLLVSCLDIDRLGGTNAERGNRIRVRERGNGPEALVNRAQIKVDLDLVVLEGNQRERKARVGAEPELERNVESRLREGVAGSANLARRSGLAGAVNGGEGRIGDEGKLGGVTNHLEVPALLLRGHRELIPDVHPVSVLAIDALASNLDLNLRNKLLSGEVQPASINTLAVSSSAEALANLGESDLEVGAVSEIAVAADRALHTASEIRLSIERLLNRLNGKVRVPAVGDLPESDLRVSS